MYFFNYSFLSVYAQEWDYLIIWQLYFWSFEEPSYHFPQGEPVRQCFPALCQTGEMGILLLSLREPCRPPGVLLIIAHSELTVCGRLPGCQALGQEL